MYFTLLVGVLAQWIFPFLFVNTRISCLLAGWLDFSLTNFKTHSALLNYRASIFSFLIRRWMQLCNMQIKFQVFQPTMLFKDYSCELLSGSVALIFHAHLQQ